MPSLGAAIQGYKVHLDLPKDVTEARARVARTPVARTRVARVPWASAVARRRTGF